MDLSTIKKKLENSDYETPTEFEQDFLLMIDNCCRYNPPENAIHQAAKKLQTAFEQEWAKMPTNEEIVQATRTKMASKSTPAIKLMLGNQEHIKETLIGMLKLLESKIQGEGKDDTKGFSYAAGKNKAKRPRKAEEVFPLTAEEKTKLGEAMNNLDQEKVLLIMPVIQRSLPHVIGEESAEFDIEELDDESLCAIYRIVFPNRRRREASKRPKREQKSEEEQAKEIEELQRKIAMFENPVSELDKLKPIVPQKTAHSSSESESESSDSESSSDED